MTNSTNNNDQGNHTYSPWNPFAPTKRDIERTEKLAEKSPVVTGVLGILFPVVAMIYLNRGRNSLKILGYLFVISFSIGVVAAVSKVSQKQLAPITHALSLGGSIVLTTENIRAVTLARKRLPSK